MTEVEMTRAIRGWLDAREWVVLPQVRNQTGFARTVRTADAVAVSTFPSKGIGAHGFECKASRADWLRELKDGSKSEEIGRFCCQWSVAAVPDAVRADEVPEKWGWIVIEDGAVRVKKKAPKREAQEPTWAFFAALVRAASVATPEADVEKRIAAALAAQEADFCRRAEAIRKAERDRLSEGERTAAGKLKAFEEASGVRIDRYGPDGGKRIGEAVKFVLGGGLGDFSGLKGARNLAARFVEDADKVIAEASGVAE